MLLPGDERVRDNGPRVNKTLQTLQITHFNIAETVQ